MTCKPGLSVGLGFFQLRVHCVILCLRLLPSFVYFENITKPSQVGHLLSSDYNVLISTVIALNSFMQYSHSPVKTFITIIPYLNVSFALVLGFQTNIHASNL